MTICKEKVATQAIGVRHSSIAETLVGIDAGSVILIGAIPIWPTFFTTVSSPSILTKTVVNIGSIGNKCVTNTMLPTFRRAHWHVAEMPFPSSQTLTSMWMTIANAIDTTLHWLTFSAVSPGPTV